MFASVLLLCISCWVFHMRSNWTSVLVRDRLSHAPSGSWYHSSLQSYRFHRGWARAWPCPLQPKFWLVRSRRSGYKWISRRIRNYPGCQQRFLSPVQMLPKKVARLVICTRVFAMIVACTLKFPMKTFIKNFECRDSTALWAWYMRGVSLPYVPCRTITSEKILLLKRLRIELAYRTLSE